MADQDFIDCGFAVEVTDTTVKIFTLLNNVFEREKLGDEDATVGQWYNISKDGYKKRDKVPINELEVFVKDGQCHVRVVAIQPNYFALPKEMRPNYKFSVWTPHLSYLHDKEFIFNRYAQAEKVEQCIVKYAPTDKFVFEIVEIPERTGDLEVANLSVYYMSPWNLEWMAKYMRPIHEVVPKDLGCNNQKKQFCIDAAAIGVCIAVKAANPKYDYANQKGGSISHCSYLWSLTFGLTRWMVQPTAKSEFGNKEEVNDDSADRLGKWYHFKLNDVRRAQKKLGTARDERPSLYCTTATSVSEVDPQMPYKLHAKPTPYLNEDRDLLIRVSFPFKRESIVEPSYGESQWNKRIQGDAHFFDVVLGKVDIYPQQGSLVLEEIEKHQKELQELSPDEYEKLKDEVIIIYGWVTVHHNFIPNSIEYPKHGIFFLKTIEMIHYLQGGRVIFSNKSDEN